LIDQLKEAVESKLSAEENAKRMEKFFLQSKQKEFELNQEIKKQSEQLFKVNQEFESLKSKERSIDAEVNGCESSLKNLQIRINRLDHEALRKVEVIYEQVAIFAFKLFLILK
jgi:septal ring factor EnvC (AmiA/AmiB activator)